MKKILLTILTICICLFASAVYAGEAWVLWEKNTESEIPSEWKVVTAYPEYKQCIERQKKDFEIIKKGYPGFKIQVVNPETITIEKPSKEVIVISLKCLPDSIDPRNKGVLPKK